MLQVVQRGQRLGDVGRARVRGRIVDLLALDPERGRSLLQAGQDLVTGSCSHDASLADQRPTSQDRSSRAASLRSGSFDHARCRLAVDDELQDVGTRVVPGGVADRLRLADVIE